MGIFFNGKKLFSVQFELKNKIDANIVVNKKLKYGKTYKNKQNYEFDII